MLFPCNKTIEFKGKFEKVKDYIFINVLTESDVTKNENIFQNIKESNFLIIDQYIDENESEEEKQQQYIVIGFKKTVINIEKSLFSILQPLLSSNPNINICFLSKIDDINIDTNSNNNSIIIDNYFQKEIDKFNIELLLSNSSSREMHKIWRFIKSCISGYLIKESYKKTKINRLNNFINFEKKKKKSSINYSFNKIPIINEDEFIELRDIGAGYGFIVYLIYHIEKEELYAQKKKYVIYDKIDDLIKREIHNYSKVQHPLIPKLIGIDNNNEYIIIEFINGRSLFEIDKLRLSFSDKITIFFELMIIIEFLHRQEFIYRDLKPNNIIIDENKTVVLIDFDRMIEKKKSLNSTTNDFTS